MRNRAERRVKAQKVKRKCKRIARDWGKEISAVFIGKLASTHGRPCSCHMCGNPRKHYKQKTLQEKKIEIREKY